MKILQKLGFKTAAMALRDDSVGIDDKALRSEEKESNNTVEKEFLYKPPN